MHGIYLDETSNHYSADRAAYLEAVHKHIKAQEGLLGLRLVCLVLPATCTVLWIQRLSAMMYETPVTNTGETDVLLHVVNNS